MSNTNNMNLNIISQSDTIRDFMEKCNDNFSKLSTLSGPAGIQGEQGEQGVPTKPKVPIHAWIKGVEYINDDNYTLSVNGDELTDTKYQEGHLIILENAHVYVLEIENNSLTPRFKIALQSYKQGSVIDGKNAYVHFAYADDVNGSNMIIPNQNYQNVNAGEESISTFSLTRAISNNNSNISEKPYMGMYCSRSSEPLTNPDIYTWVRIRGRDGDVGPTGPQGSIGPQGPQGPEGSPFTGQNYTIDLQGDMAMVSLNIDRTIRNQSSSCKCTIYAYYGDENVELNKDHVSFNVNADDYINKDLGYKISDNKLYKIVNKDDGTLVKETLGIFTISQNKNNKDVDIEFKPENSFIFPEATLIFPIKVETYITDKIDGKEKTYNFTRKTIWSIKGIVSNFSLEIVPQYRTIKLSDGEYTPDNLKVDVYKLEDGTRTLFNLNESENFNLLYKNNNVNNWTKYRDAVDTKDVSCLEFKVVKNYNTENEEIWDYEDVWVVADGIDGIDGKDAHYYHADLGNTESMMVLTTGVKQSVKTINHGIQDCAELRNESGYTITFNPKFYDGTNELTVTEVSIGSNSGDEYYLNGDGSFSRELIKETYNDDSDSDITSYKYTFKVTSVPYGVEVIPMNFDVLATDGVATYNDSIPFNIYISTITNIYSLVPSVSAFNTSTGIIDEDVITCAVYKNNDIINTNELSDYGLSLKYKIYNNGDDPKEGVYPEGGIKYSENGFAAEDVGIEFILCYIEDSVVRPVVRSTVPLIKDGIDGKDGDSWQYIFCRSDKYPFSKTEISNPFEWYGNDDKTHTDSNEEYIPDIFKYIWFDDHQGVDKDHKYEYQSYRKWNKEGKYWGQYTSPTLYSNYSEDGRSGSGYSVLLSNPVAVIPVGDDWTADKEDSTIVYLYDNVSEITDFVIDVDSDSDNDLNSKHFTQDSDNPHKIIFTPTITIGEGSESHTFNFDSNTPYKLPIKITYGGNSEDEDFTTTINWTLMPIKGLDDVEVFVDKRVVNISEETSHSITVGYYSISSNGGRTFVGNYDERGKYDIMITNDISSLTEDKIVSNWSGYSLNFSIATKYFVVLVEKDENNTYNLIDSIDITPISDGKDGSSAIHLELTNDYIPVPCNDAGKLHEQFDGPISSQMILYDGDIPITSGVKYKIKINEEYDNDKNKNASVIINDDGTFSITNDNSFIYENITGDTHITCTAIYNNVPYHKTLFIDFELNPYELELNKQVLVRDVNNGKITDTLAVRVKYWDSNADSDGAGWVYVDGTEKDKNNKAINSVIIDDINDIPFTYLSTDKCWTLEFSDNNSIKHSENEFKISYCKNGSELSHEYIGVVNSGKNGEDGTTPTNTSVKVLGYSIKDKETCEGAIDIDENLINANNIVWRPSISDWGSEVKPGQTIYILNEHTWEDENGSPLTSTRSISTTMSGTQGADGANGKSRVLFYLGSFEKDKATLKDDVVYGHLTPERCDYYIDYNGQAWMRIGQEDIDNGGLGVVGHKGSKDANNNSVNNNSSDNWQKSEIVGFLQAGAIHANMINADTLSTNEAFAEAIKAMTVYADEITGKTIKSGEIIPGSDSDSDSDTGEPTWQINNEGDGWLACKNIRWEKNGDLTINGTINGLIGGSSESVTINGDLVINNEVNVFNDNYEITNTKENTSMILCGNHLYKDPLSKDKQNIYISLSNGFCDTLYCWTISKDDIANISDDGDDVYIPEKVYTKYNYRNSQNKTKVIELYIEKDNVYYLFNTYDFAFVYPRIFDFVNNTYDTDDEVQTGGYINLTINEILYKYYYSNTKELDSIENKINTSSTRLFSDGQLYTNSIFASDGQYYGNIYSSGEFSGELINASGSIYESKIYSSIIEDATISISNISNSKMLNSNIELYENNYIVAYNSESNKIFEINGSDNFYTPPSEYKSEKQSYSYTNTKLFKEKKIKETKVLISDIYYVKGQSISLANLTVTTLATTPNRVWTDENDAKNIKAVVELYWRYKNNTDDYLKNKICQFGGNNSGVNWYGLNNDRKKYDGYDDIWRTEFTRSATIKPIFLDTESTPVTPDTNGYIEIVASINCTLPDAEDDGDTTIKVTFSSFNITLSATGTRLNSPNSVVINNGGITITGGHDNPPTITSNVTSGFIILSSGFTGDNSDKIVITDEDIRFTTINGDTVTLSELVQFYKNHN